MFCIHPNQNISNDLCMQCKTAICLLCRDNHLPLNKHKLLNYQFFLDKIPNDEQSEIKYFEKKLDDIQKFLKILSRLLEKAEKDIIAHAKENYMNLSRFIKEKDKFFDDKKDEINVAYNLTQFYNEDGSSILINDLEAIFKDIKTMCDNNLINLLRKVANFKKNKISIENIVFIDDDEGRNMKIHENNQHQENNENQHIKRNTKNEVGKSEIVSENENNKPKVGNINCPGRHTEMNIESIKNKENFVGNINSQLVSENQENIINIGSGFQKESTIENRGNQMENAFPERILNNDIEEKKNNSTFPIEKLNSNGLIICDKEFYPNFDFDSCKRVKKTGKKINKNKIEEEITE